MIAALEEILFRHRGFVLALLALFTLVSVGFCTRLELDTAVETHLPAEHEYMRTFLDYQEALLGTDRVLVVLRARQGDIWNVASLRKLKQVTDTLAALPGIDRRTVMSLWTPNVTYMELTEEGLHTEDIVGAEFNAQKRHRSHSTHRPATAQKKLKAEQQISASAQLYLGLQDLQQLGLNFDLLTVVLQR